MNQPGWDVLLSRTTHAATHGKTREGDSMGISRADIVEPDIQVEFVVEIVERRCVDYVSHASFPFIAFS
jgi:hypothetical protein